MTSKLASLHSGLVARKGEAMPAVSHPMFSYVDTPRPVAREVPAETRRAWPPAVQLDSPESVAAPSASSVTHSESPAPVATSESPPPTVQTRPVPSVARAESRHVSTRSEGDENDVQNSPRHRFTFRLTHDQHHRLRLAAAIRDQSLQHLLSEALDNHLEGLCACSLKDCACLAAAEAQRR